MFHTLAFYTNNLGVSATNTALGAVQDQAIGQQNSRYQMPTDMRVFAGFAMNSDLVSARINTPSLRRIAYPYIDPGVYAATIPDNPPVPFWGESGPIIEATEEVTVEMSRGAAVASDAYALLFVRPRFTPAQNGPIITARYTSTVIVAEGVWSIGNLTADQILPAGRYQVVGMSAYGANLLASRLVFSGQVLRPGVLSQEAIGGFNDARFRNGNVGLFGEFTSYTQPQIEFFGVGAGASQTVFLDLIKVA